MKFFRFLLPCLLILLGIYTASAQDISTANKNDTITLAQAYMNLYLVEIYFDTIPEERLKKIIAYENDQIKAITNSTFIRANSSLYNFTNALFYQNQTKLLHRSSDEVSRGLLRRLKSLLDRGINYYNSAKIEDFQTFDKKENSLFELIKFDQESNLLLKSEIRSLKNELNTLFNEDLYPDFQRIFLAAKNKNQFHIDSLEFYAGIYSMPLSREIITNKPDFQPFSFGDPNFINPDYTPASRLDLLSRYVQLKYVVSKRTRVGRNFNKRLLYDQFYDFKSSVTSERDKFIKEELNPKVLEALYRELCNKFPLDKDNLGEELSNGGSAMVQMPSNSLQYYFFPNPAPLASANFIKADFKPSLSTLGQVDSFLRKDLVEAGYKNQLHYYYDMDGFALTTSLEKFRIDGSSVPTEQRFTQNLGGDGKFTYFEIFKSMFFKVESEFRMFAFIVASNPATMSNVAMTPGVSQQLLKNSYDTLPDDLKKTSLPNKVLSIFVYHFHQNDIGEVPELDLSGKLTVQDHLKTAGLLNIVQ
ncbi:hypothetical protein [Algoriphagus winogradskyi]|uniref:Uncharacterized protein n=1 Tax=Algoriphagus winogradskyi TaxID=237017 RepID=A0ABY1NDS9_9BACT|nr:hypothetical protein [Algoriphagus winogradskyi]SMP06654.1 hypothetical protein SAMN06265367_101500 [Algoriphagus winogradskyi]